MSKIMVDIFLYFGALPRKKRKNQPHPRRGPLRRQVKFFPFSLKETNESSGVGQPDNNKKMAVLGEDQKKLNKYKIQIINFSTNEGFSPLAAE